MVNKTNWRMHENFTNAVQIRIFFIANRLFAGAIQGLTAASQEQSQHDTRFAVIHFS
jgi:hypothetical protein